MWPPSLKHVPTGHYGSESINMDSCYGSPEKDETLGWLDRKFRHIKEEIAMTELRLHDLRQDLAALKAHVDQYQRHISQTSLECQTPHPHSL